MNKFFNLSVSLVGSSSFALASLPLGIGSATAQEAKTTQRTAADLGVMSISLKDAIKSNFGFQGALQGAGTPNQAGIGGFLPLVTGDNSVFFLDAQANLKGTSKKELFPSFSCSKKMPFGKWQSYKLTSIVKIDLQFTQFYELNKR